MSENFKPIIRFMAVSDIHYKDEDSVERERMAKALKTAYGYAKKQEYDRLDAVCVIGDFANSGTDIQMQAFKDTLDAGMDYGETELLISVASHEYNENQGGPKAAWARLKKYFNSEPDTHKVINGFHFVSVSPSERCRFHGEKQAWVKEQMKIAAKDDPKKPIFFLQHPHPSGTVYGSINWGEDELIAILMNYPQTITFSGHSHAPINDPRSVHQKHFTSFGTGTLSYFELDEFDKMYGTCPPGMEKAAQFLIVEADADNRVRVYPYDLISGNFFPFVHKVDEPSNPDSFIYTDKRYEDTTAPYFTPEAKLLFDPAADKCGITFTQAKIDKEYVNDYFITLREKATGVIVKKLGIWSEYYFYDMPESLSLTAEDLEPGTEYTVEVAAYSFWNTPGSNKLCGEFKTL